MPGVKHLDADGVSHNSISKAENMTLLGHIYAIHQDDSSDEPQPHSILPHSFFAGLCMHELDITDGNFFDAALTEAANFALNSVKSVTWNLVKTAITSDKFMVKLISLIEDGGILQFQHELPRELQEFHKVKDGLPMTDSVVMSKTLLLSHYHSRTRYCNLYILHIRKSPPCWLELRLLSSGQPSHLLSLP